MRLFPLHEAVTRHRRVLSAVSNFISRKTGLTQFRWASSSHPMNIYTKVNERSGTAEPTATTCTPTRPFRPKLLLAHSNCRPARKTFTPTKSVQVNANSLSRTVKRRTWIKRPIWPLSRPLRKCKLPSCLLDTKRRTTMALIKCELQLYASLFGHSAGPASIALTSYVTARSAFRASSLKVNLKLIWWQRSEYKSNVIQVSVVCTSSL